MQFITNKLAGGQVPELKIIKLGSDVGATKNMIVYECGDDIVIFDCGVGFPDSELLGVDVVIPDVTYLLDRKDKLRALFVTHGHEDHLGAIPYVIEQLDVPIYANMLVQGFIKTRLKDKAPKHVAEGVSFKLITPETEPIKLGNFEITAFRVNHSVPSTFGFAIKTPQGTVLHVSDFKVDWTPVLDKPIELGKIAKFADDGVLCLLSDCLGVETSGYSKSEKTLAATFDTLFKNAHGRQIFLTTISSNISRMYQVIEAAIKHGRKVAFIGRSIDQSATVARELKYLPFDAVNFIDERQVSKYEPDSLVHIIAGCYGQPDSALERLGRGAHKYLTLEENALVIFSADPSPPGVQEPVEKLLHNLTISGAEVLYSEIQENLHVSGHGLKGDKMLVAAISKAKYYIPIGGTAATMRAYTKMLEELEIDKNRSFELLEGETLIFNEHTAKLGDRIDVKQVFIDGAGVGDIGEIVINDREQLANDGIFVVAVPISKETHLLVGDVEVITRGFIYVKESMGLINKAEKIVKQVLDDFSEKASDWQFVRARIEKELSKFLYNKTGRKPVILVTKVAI